MKTSINQTSIEVPESAVLRREEGNRYGSVEGLEDNELADPEELERVIFIEQWWPVLQLPETKYRSHIKPVREQDGHWEWGAFGSMDFLRQAENFFDKARYKADKLKDELKRSLIMQEMLSERVGSVAQFKIIKYLHLGIIDLEHITNSDMVAMARWHFRAIRLRREISELRQRSRPRGLWAGWL